MAETAAVFGEESSMAANVHVSGAQLPLSMVSEGQTATVARVKGNPERRQLLAERGFVEGAQVKVVSRVNGDVIVNVKGATFGIGRDMAKHITTA